MVINTMETLEVLDMIQDNKTMHMIIYGKDASRMDLKLEEIKKKYKDLERKNFDLKEDEQGTVLNALDTRSLFEEKRLFIIKNADFLGKSQKDVDYEVKAKEWIERLETEDILVFLLAQDQLTKKKEWQPFFEQAALLACKSLDAKNQKAYVLEQIKKISLSIDPEALQWFIAHIGTNSKRILDEIDKLSLYPGEIHLEEVQKLVSSEPIEDVFKMSDALFEKNGLKLIAYYRNFRAQNMETLQIIALLASQIRFLFQVRVYMDGGYPKEKIIDLTKAHPYRIQLMMKKASRFEADELLHELSQLARLDYQLKTGLIDRDEGFENFALSLMPEFQTKSLLI